ncbi:MAG TPA: exodeoxyribonuclease VII large subunit, partial [Burkholderiaceae bacterium]|nr:exodeoxyribonuclease VII large subunit [Burkholderiaceae bacterium]
QSKQDLPSFVTEVRAQAHRLTQLAQHGSTRHLTLVSEMSKGTLSRARADTERRSADVRSDAARVMRQARHALPEVYEEVKQAAGQRARLVWQSVQGLAGEVFQQASRDCRTAHNDVEQRGTIVAEHSRRTLKEAKEGTTSLMREVAGQGPKKTLARGFAIVTAGGRAVTNAEQYKQMPPDVHLGIEFHDGRVTAIKEEKN